MNGPDHYREAERLLELAKYPRVITGDLTAEDCDRIKAQFGDESVVAFSERVEIHDVTVSAAQVHATLALAAAAATDPHDTTARRLWHEAVQP